MDKHVGSDASLGRTTWIEHEIILTSEHPVKQRCYQKSEITQKEMHDQVDKLQKDVIKQSIIG